MKDQSQAEKARRLLYLHSGGKLLILPNVWDPIGARILAAKGYPAVATASAALSSSLGYQDGERISRETLLHFIGRIAESVDVPVTADIEAGFGNSVAELEETTRLIIEAGAVGINIEDSIKHEGILRPMTEQCRRISAVRQAAHKVGVPLVINARVDCFLASIKMDKPNVMQETATRARAYAEAGADCIYPIGPGDVETVRELRSRIPHPINILASQSAAPLSALEELGVNRVSFGPFLFRLCLTQFVQAVEGLQAGRDFPWSDRMLTSADVQPFLRGERE